ncbi:MAG: outer membrane beta-barrel protein [Terracidiphilus sp.]|jgi:opacity protein-like surface antigen
MQSSFLQAAILTVGLGTMCTATAHAQADAVKSLSQTDVSVSIYGAFSGATTGDGIYQSPSNAAGGIFEVRHISNPILGFEGTYSFNRANQVYTPQVACPVVGILPSCPPPPAIVSSNAHELTADWVPSVKFANLRPFGVLGLGLLLNEPSSGQVNTTSSNKGAFVYGAGLDWGLLPHIGVRLQYRGNLYHAPDLTTLYGSSGAFMRTSEPMIGVYLRL